jgi:hypothetical protein
MLVYKTWLQLNGKYHYQWEGWYLLGFIPLYLRRRQIP